jgi:hypothetical protein
VTPSASASLRKTTVARWLPWLLAVAGFAFDSAAYWPGQMSFDSAYTWWQARGGATTDIVPPIFVWVWRLSDLVVDGPGLLFAFHLLVFWTGLALLARALRFGPFATMAMMLFVAFTPVPWLLRGHVWTDVGLFSALTCGCGALVYAETRRQRRWLLLIAAMLFYAGMLRYNALPAILPWLAWFVWQTLRGGREDVKPALSKVALTTLVVLVAFVAANHLMEKTVARHVPLWPSLAQFDLAAMSVTTNTMLLPDFMIGPGLDIADLTQAFRGWSNTPMLANTRHGMRDPFASDYSDEDLSRLRHAWLDAIATHPRVWLAHRWQLTRALFGTHAPEWPHELIYVDDEVRYRDNPPIARNVGALHALLMRAAAASRATPLLAAWPDLLLGLVALPLAWRRRRAVGARTALILLASTWLYALPLTLLAPSAELRYLGWPCVASLLAFACAVSAPRAPAR